MAVRHAASPPRAAQPRSARSSPRSSATSSPSRRCARPPTPRTSTLSSREYYAVRAKAIESPRRHCGEVHRRRRGRRLRRPAAHEDDPERAVRAGLRLIEELEGLTRPDGSPLQVARRRQHRRGLRAPRRRPGVRRGFLTGDAVNAAARLRGRRSARRRRRRRAHPRAHGARLDYEELAPSPSKARPSRSRPGSPRAPVARTGLRTTGRASDALRRPRRGARGTLDGALRRRPSPSVAAVRSSSSASPASARAAWCSSSLTRLDAQPELVTWRQGRCLPYGEGVTFWALAEIVKAHAGILDTDDRGRRGRSSRRCCPRARTASGCDSACGPRSVLRRRRPRRRRTSPPGCASSRRSPPTAPRSSSSRICTGPTTACSPSSSTSRRTRWRRRCSSSRRRGRSSCEAPRSCASSGETHRLDPSPLTARDASSLVSALLDERLARTSARRSSSAWAVTRSTPRSTCAAARPGLLLRTSGVLRLRRVRSLPLPDTVQAVLAARLDTLPPEHKAVLSDAAVFGERLLERRRRRPRASASDGRR